MVSMVVYFSRGKNTRKVAEVIAKELGTEAIDVKKQSPDASTADLLVIGSGTYGGKPGKRLTTYLKNLAPANGKNAACFATYIWNPTRNLTTMQETLKTKEYKIIESFACCGRWFLFKRGHPTTEELNKAQEFARQLRMTSKASTRSH